MDDTSGTCEGYLQHGCFADVTLDVGYTWDITSCLACVKADYMHLLAKIVDQALDDVPAPASQAWTGRPWIYIWPRYAMHLSSLDGQAHDITASGKMLQPEVGSSHVIK